MRSTFQFITAFVPVWSISILLATSPCVAATPLDEAHNHDGSHPDGPKNCGGNYMLPGEIARLGSHSFMILGQDGDSHIIAEHRSGTPPHNYQFLLRVRLDANELAQYKEILRDSKTLPAFTTIYFDENGKQLDRTFFCLPDLEKIFGAGQKKGDEFERLFPIRASLQKNPDHEGGFDIVKSVARGKYLSLDRADIEILVYRYLPSYLPQDALRAAIQQNGPTTLSLLAHAPIRADEAVASASVRTSYMKKEGSAISKTEVCPRNYYLKKTDVFASAHGFMLMSELDKNHVLAVHYYDQAPQNFQTVWELKLDDDEMNTYRSAKKGSKAIPFLLTQDSKGKFSYFCMENVAKAVQTDQFKTFGTVYRDTDLVEFKLGQPIGGIQLASSDIKILVNRRLESFMNPLDVAKEVAKSSARKILSKPKQKPSGDY